MKYSYARAYASASHTHTLTHTRSLAPAMRVPPGNSFALCARNHHSQTLSIARALMSLARTRGFAHWCTIAAGK